MFPDPNCWFITSFRIDKHIQKYFSFFSLLVFIYSLSIVRCDSLFITVFVICMMRVFWYILCSLFGRFLLFCSFPFIVHSMLILVLLLYVDDSQMISQLFYFIFFLSQRQHKNINFVNLSVRAHTSTSDVSYFWYIHQHCKVVISFSFGTQKISRKSEFEVVITSWCDWWGLFCIIYSVFWRAEEESLY